jgi:DNA modification methylase
LRAYFQPAPQIGLEKTPEEYVAKMVAVFREVRRVLRKDGTLWLNLGDSYNGSGRKETQVNSPKQMTNRGATSQIGTCVKNIKPKDLVGIPWMVAFALRADGWYLRQDIIWHKPNPMPESVTDRCTKAHEYIFLLSKSERYYYDAKAIAEPVSQAMLQQIEQGYNGESTKDYASGGAQNASETKKRIIESARASWNGSSFDKGKTGEMKHTRGGLTLTSGKHSVEDNQASGHRMVESVARARKEGADHDAPFGMTRNKRSVWTVTTKPFKGAHFATFPPDLIKPCVLAGCPVGGTVLDPFGGSGTTGMVALELGRSAILIELNEKYVKLIEQRTDITPGLHLS